MRKYILYALFPVVLAAIIMGCGNKEDLKGDVIATVNGEPVYAKDVEWSIELNKKRDPMFKLTPLTFKEQVDMIIDKKLLIQEARKEKLDRTERFVSTIQSFWEQTLIRDLMDQRSRNIVSSIKVSESEIEGYYKNISHQKVFQVLRTADKEKVSRLVLKDPKDIEWEETVGPITYDDASAVMKKAFAFSEGRMKVIEDGGTYFLFFVKSDKSIPLGPLADIRNKIGEKIMNDRKNEMFDGWLGSVRRKATIDINSSVMKGMSSKYEDQE
ncbi:MAG: hypothetical protein HQL30_00680 [Candidatus Omnitrophica bacterium]|nr:hypothetical protein [Candidatus Omnitrophota bacterium]